MALTDAQKLSIRLALGEPKDAVTSIETALALLDSTDEARLATLITQYDALYIDPTKMKIDGVDIDNERTLARVREAIATLVGWTVDNPGEVIVGRGYIGEFGDSAQRSFFTDPEWNS